MASRAIPPALELLSGWKTVAMLSSVAHAPGGKGEEKVKVHHGRRTGSTFMFTKI